MTNKLVLTISFGSSPVGKYRQVDIEKPAGMTLEEAIKLIDAAKEDMIEAEKDVS